MEAKKHRIQLYQTVPDVGYADPARIRRNQETRLRKIYQNITKLQLIMNI